MTDSHPTAALLPFPLTTPPGDAALAAAAPAAWVAAWRRRWSGP